MKFTINSKLLRSALESASRVIPSKTQTPILGNFYINTGNGNLNIVGTDANVTIIREIPADIAEGNEAVIPLSLLELVRTLPDEDITIATEGNACSVSWKNGNSTLPTFDPKDYPAIKVPGDGNSVSILADVFTSAISHTVQFTDSDELRPALSGVFFNIKSDHIDVVASDTRVLAIYKINLELPAEPSSFIIPANALNAVRGTIADAHDLSIATDETSILIRFGNTTIISRKIIGKFPNYESIIPKDFAADLTAKKSDFINTFKRISTCASKAAGTLKLSLSILSSTVEAQDTSFSVSAKETPESFNYSGPDIQIGFRNEYLIKAVGAMDSDTVIIKLNDPRKAAIIEGENDPCTILLMPVQI